MARLAIGAGRETEIGAAVKEIKTPRQIRPALGVFVIEEELQPADLKSEHPLSVICPEGLPERGKPSGINFRRKDRISRLLGNRGRLRVAHLKTIFAGQSRCNRAARWADNPWSSKARPRDRMSSVVRQTPRRCNRSALPSHMSLIFCNSFSICVMMIGPPCSTLQIGELFALSGQCTPSNSPGTAARSGGYAAPDVSEASPGNHKFDLAADIRVQTAKVDPHAVVLAQFHKPADVGLILED